MGIIRLARLAGRLFRGALAAYVLTGLAMLGWTSLWPEPDLRNLKAADAIVCLGGGMAPNGTLADAVLTRVERCVQLYQAGLAPVVVFSGGVRRLEGPSAGGQMGRFAVSLGLPEQAVTVEGLAQSTLQNALFTLALAPDAERFIVVTEAFHLPRAWVSFRWAAKVLGLPNRRFDLAMSENVRRVPPDNAVNWHILTRESLAIWFNAGRILAYQAGGLVGIPAKTRTNWLR
ncbi:MAG: YdcF family protein [Octadecabacter sp.]|nr:YdcF family protein [Octadecabacter sp.]